MSGASSAGLVAEPAVDVVAFKAAAGQFASGVTVVATRRDGATTAKTVSAFSSLSLDPPLVGAAIGGDTLLARTLGAGGGFGISVLRHDQSRVSDYFATAAHRRQGDAPAGFVTSVRPDAPVLDECLSWFGCQVVELVPAGDHVIVLGRVLAVRAAAASATPLVHHAGRYRGVSSDPSPHQEP